MKSEIAGIVRKYTETIHTQDESTFKSLWAKNAEVTLISITKCFNGLDAIYGGFLIDGIRKSYQSINLICDELTVKPINDNLAIAVFAYHTECVRRDTLEAYGIKGLETQVFIKEDNQWRIQHIHYSK